MVKKNAPILNFSGMSVQNSATNLDKAIIQSNIDEMAKALACKTDITQAWQTIFRMPRGVTAWNQVKVAIKINGIGENHPRLAIVDKVCRVLNTVRGVPFTNMTIFDSKHGSEGLYTSFVGTQLPAGINVSDAHSSWNPTPTGGTWECSDALTQAHLFVDIAVNKGHDQWNNNGATTLTMKNLFGAVRLNSGCPNVDDLRNMTICDTVLGGDPPKLQLCIIDSLWAMKNGPGGVPGDWVNEGEDPNNYRIIMGILPGAVDYLTVKKVREPEVHATHNASCIDRYLSIFGYSDTVRNTLLTQTPAPQTAGPGWVEVGGVTGVDGGSVSPVVNNVDVHLTTTRGVTSTVRFDVPAGERIGRFQVLDPRGRVVRELDVTGAAAFWDGRSDQGSAVAAGTYLVKAHIGSREVAQSLVVR